MSTYTPATATYVVVVVDVVVSVEVVVEDDVVVEIMDASEMQQ